MLPISRLVQFKTVWRDGTSHFLFEPIEFLEKLAALIPRPAVNLLVYHGVLAPRAHWRSQVVRYARPAPDGIALTLEATPRSGGPTQAWTWAALMRRVFALDVLACPRCGAGCESSPPFRTQLSCAPSRPPRLAPARQPRPAPPARPRGHRVTLGRSEVCPTTVTAARAAVALLTRSLTTSRSRAHDHRGNRIRTARCLALSQATMGFPAPCSPPHGSRDTVWRNVSKRHLGPYLLESQRAAVIRQRHECSAQDAEMGPHPANCAGSADCPPLVVIVVALLIGPPKPKG